VKLKIGTLYEDERVMLSRSASGAVTFWCKTPLTIWNVAQMPGDPQPDRFTIAACTDHESESFEIDDQKADQTPMGSTRWR
jgi:hypothetical protein